RVRPRPVRRTAQRDGATTRASDPIPPDARSPFAPPPRNPLKFDARRADRTLALRPLRPDCSLVSAVSRKGKPIERWGRKAKGLRRSRENDKAAGSRTRWRPNAPGPVRRHGRAEPPERVRAERLQRGTARRLSLPDNALQRRTLMARSVAARRPAPSAPQSAPAVRPSQGRASQPLRMSEDDLSQVWKTYKRTQDRNLRDLLLETHLPLVRMIAERLLQTLPKSIELDDLTSA